MRADGVVPMRRSAVTNRYVTVKNDGKKFWIEEDVTVYKYPYPRFLMIPELRQGERWKLAAVIDNPFFKQGPLLQWQSHQRGTVMINRQLFYMMMTGRMK